MKQIKAYTLKEVLQHVRNSPPPTPEQLTKQQEILKKLGPGGHIILRVPPKP